MEAYTIEINGIRLLIVASCIAEAKYKASRLNGMYVAEFPIEDFKVMNQIKKNL